MLAEMVGCYKDVESEGPNWQKLNQKKNMQRWGSQSAASADKNDPMAGFRKLKQQQAASQPPSMIPKPGGLQIPAGSDRPGQGNLLMAPPRAVSVVRPPLSTKPDQQQQPQDDQSGEGESWMDMLMGGEDSDDDNDSI